MLQIWTIIKLSKKTDIFNPASKLLRLRSLEVEN